MAGDLTPRKRFVRRRPPEPPPKETKVKSYPCPACHGTVHVHGRGRTLDEVKAIHEATCPAHLRLGKK